MALTIHDQFRLIKTRQMLEYYHLPWQDLTAEQALEYAIYYEAKNRGAYPGLPHIQKQIQDLYMDYAELLEKAEN